MRHLPLLAVRWLPRWRHVRHTCFCCSTRGTRQISDAAVQTSPAEASDADQGASRKACARPGADEARSSSGEGCDSGSSSFGQAESSHYRSSGDSEPDAVEKRTDGREGYAAKTSAERQSSEGLMGAIGATRGGSKCAGPVELGSSIGLFESPLSEEKGLTLRGSRGLGASTCDEEKA